MATADQVVVELQAKVDGYTAPINTASTSLVQFASKAEESATRAEKAITTSGGNANSALLILQASARRTADQFVAGAPVATILAEHISGIAEAAELAGGASNLLGIAISGGLGLAVTAILPLLIDFGGELIHGSEAADEHKQKTESLTDAIAKLAAATDKAIQSAQAAAQADVAAAHALDIRALSAANAAEKVAQAQRRIAEVAKAAETDPNSFSPTVGGGNLLGAVFANSSEKKADAAGVTASQKATDALAAQRATSAKETVVLQQQISAATSDSAAAIQKYEKTLDDLNEKYAQGAISQKEYVAAGIAATRARDAVTEYKAPPKPKNQDTEAYALAAANAKLANATDDVTRAEAELAIVQAKRRDYTPAQYQAALTSAGANIAEAKSLQELQKATQGVVDALSKRADAGFKSFTRDGDADTRQTLADANGANKGRGNEVDAAFQKQLQQQEQGVRTLASLYQDLFQNGTKGIFDDFERLGEQALAKLAAKQTISLLANLFPAGSGIGNLLSGLTGNDTGGSFTVGGSAGMDNNVLSVNGVPQRRVSQGETIAVIPKAQAMAQQGAVSAGGGGSESVVRHEFVFTPSPLFNASVQSQVVSGIIAAAPTIISSAKTQTLNDARRPTLPQALG